MAAATAVQEQQQEMQKKVVEPRQPFTVADFGEEDEEDEYGLEEANLFEEELLRREEREELLDPIAQMKSWQKDAFAGLDAIVKETVEVLVVGVESSAQKTRQQEAARRNTNVALFAKGRSPMEEDRLSVTRVQFVSCDECSKQWPLPSELVVDPVKAAHGCQMCARELVPTTCTHHSANWRARCDDCHLAWKAEAEDWAMAEVVLPGVLRPVTVCSDCLVQQDVLTQPRLRSELIERQIPTIREEMFVAGEYAFGNKELRTLRLHREKMRRGQLSKPRLQKPRGGWRPNQRKILEPETPSEMKAVLAERFQGVIESLSPDYLQVRVAVLKIWIMFALEVCQETPFRMFWPDTQGDDELFLLFVSYLSLRYVTYACVRTAMMHVIEFHMSWLHVHPPTAGFPRTAWFLKKLKLAMAKERPEGRKRRPGLPGVLVNKIMQKIWDCMLSTKSSSMRKLYVNIGAALSFAFEQAMRVGNVCPGTKFDASKHLSRTTIAAVLVPREELRAKGSVVVQPPVSKTTYSSEEARERTNRARLFDCKSEMHYAFARWGPMLAEMDPLLAGEDPSSTPAFRMGGCDSPALAYTQALRVLKLMAMEVIPDWAEFDYGGHSLRIGRLNDFLSLVTESGDRLADDEQINAWSMHTTTKGRAPYGHAQVQKELRLVRAAETAEYVRLEVVQKFPEDRSVPRPSVYVQPEQTEASRELKSFVEEAKPLLQPEELQMQNETKWTAVTSEMQALVAETSAVIVPRVQSANGGAKREAQSVGAVVAIKRRRKWDFNLNKYTWETSAPVVETSNTRCTICGGQSNLFGLPSDGVRRWCAPCGKARGGTRYCR
eukprot:SAG11_NODE_6_length_32111_cov_33.703174_2_plen_834_part_00